MIELPEVTTEFVRRPRPAPPRFSTDEVCVSALSAVRPRSGGPSKLLAVVAVCAMLGVGAMAWSSGSAFVRSPVALAFPAMMLVSTIGMVVQGSGRRGAVELDDHRRRYLDYLSSVSGELQVAAALQHDALTWVHPAPSTLWTLVGGCRMWERGVGDSDFAHVRVGLGNQRLCRPIVVPAMPPADDLDPVTASALCRFVQAHAAVRDMPVAVALRGVAVLGVAGRTGHARALIRAMLCQLAVLHSPDDLLIAAVLGGAHRGHWDWLKWLPHNGHPVTSGAKGPEVMVYDTVAEAVSALAGLVARRAAFDRTAPPLDRPHIVVVLDGSCPAGSGRLFGPDGLDGVTVVAVAEGCEDIPAGGALLLQIDDDRLAVRTDAGSEVFARADQLTHSQARTCARRLARYRGRGREPHVDGLRRWCAELGLDDAGNVMPESPWGAGLPRNRLRVPIGTTVSGVLLDLDIKEAAEGGIGPHGLCVGATGSGKSELLRTVVLGMIARHPPEQLNLVLVDFKGGATFLDLEGLHHVAAVITNLSEEAHLVARMKDALAGEIHRRQQLLRQAGNVANLAGYRLLRGADAGSPPLPALFIVVDEFAELLHHHPDFVETFTAVARVGRSLGMHLLLASQRMDEGRLRGLESHLSYRICLKTLTATESRAVLGVGDAAELPPVPGAALLRTSDGVLTRFQSVYLGAAHHGSSRRTGQRIPASVAVEPFTSIPSGPAAQASRPEPRRTVTDVVIDRFAGRGARAHPVWLPPQAGPLELGALLSSTPATAGLTAAIGMVDVPFEQRRIPLAVDLSGAAGNVAVVGAPQTGKSGTVRTIVTALASHHDARRIQFYCLDFGGGTLGVLRCLPHTGTVVTRHDDELVRRTVAHIESVLRSREKLFSDSGIASIDEYRRNRVVIGGEGDADPYGDVFLVVDGWQAFRDEFTDLEATITAIAAQGLSFGVHVLLSAGRWADIRPALKDQMGSRIELRLGDPIDSDMDRKQAALVPLGRPGCGIDRHGRHFIIATSDAADVDGDQRWQAPAVRLLPDAIDHDELIRHTGDDRARILIGIGESDLAPAALDFGQQSHLLVLGDSECGKSAVLRTLCREIVRNVLVQPAEVFLVDYRRSLLDAIGAEHLAGYAFSAPALADQLPTLVARLERRLPNAHTTAQQLRDGSWWTGPEIYVVVDDYDLVSAAPGDPLGQLLSVLPHARDIGLHLVVSRRCAGTARTMFDPLMAQLRDSGCLGLLMSGSPDEGPVLGDHRPAPQRPGRGLLVTRGASQLVQVGWCPP